MPNLHIYVSESIKMSAADEAQFSIAFAGTSLFGHNNHIFRLALDIADWYGSQHIEHITDKDPNPEDFDSW